MTVQTVALSSLEPGRGNPRKARSGIEGLMQGVEGMKKADAVTKTYKPAR